MDEKELATVIREVRGAVVAREINPAALLARIKMMPMDVLAAMTRLLLCEASFRLQIDTTQEMGAWAADAWSEMFPEGDQPWEMARLTDLGRAWVLATGRDLRQVVRERCE